MTRTQKSTVAILFGAVAITGAWFALDRRTTKPTQTQKVAQRPTEQPGPPKDLHSFVAKHAKDPSPEVQDQVGAARIRLAYASAHNGKWEEARAQLITAEKEYKGTNKQSPDFGGIPDQARYQAIVCLVAEGKKQEAIDGFVDFMKSRPLSPLCHACFQRLLRMNDGKSKPEWETLLQKDTDAQEANVQQEGNGCGPKCIERVAAILQPGFKDPGFKAIASLCGTTGKGTSLDGMCKALRTLGITAFPYSLSGKDALKAPLPAIFLKRDHYFVVEKVSLGKATIYDPYDSREHVMDLRQADPANLSVDAILFQPLAS